jgi:site-specific recombinase XerD
VNFERILFDFSTLSYRREFKCFNKKILLLVFDEFAAKGLVIKRIVLDQVTRDWIIQHSPCNREKLIKLRRIIVNEIPVRSKNLKVVTTANNRPVEFNQYKVKKGGETLRQTYIRHLLDLRAPIQMVAELVGHKSLGSPAKYAGPVTPNELKRNHSMCHPKELAQNRVNQFKSK